MRRPLKPFVTEYRGSSRRKDASSPSSRDMREDDGPRKGVFGASGRYNGGEDSYEAALKAADALFSPQPSRSPPANSLVTAKAWSPEATDTIDPGAVASVEDKPTGGRILRAIEQEEPVAVRPTAPDRPMARRGRKPGSKNKPKPTAVVFFASGKSAKPIKALSVTANGVGIRSIKPAVSSQSTGKSVTSAPASMTKAAPRPAGRKRIDTFAWVRTRLKPGEKWKRRLPKVVW